MQLQASLCKKKCDANEDASANASLKGTTNARGLQQEVQNLLRGEVTCNTCTSIVLALEIDCNHKR